MTHEIRTALSPPLVYERQFTKVTRTTTSFSTTVSNDPWDFFRASVAARYYF